MKPEYYNLNLKDFLLNKRKRKDTHFFFDHFFSRFFSPTIFVDKVVLPPFPISCFPIREGVQK